MVSDSPTLRTAFNNVEISTVQSCTYSDSAKNGHRFSVSTFCSLFLTFSTVMTCKACLMLLGKISSISSYANNQLVKERTFMPFFLNTLVLLNHKFGKCEKVQVVGKMYSHCRKGFNVGTRCIVIEGALAVPFNTNKTVTQKFYYCFEALCISNLLSWTNIRYL